MSPIISLHLITTTPITISVIITVTLFMQLYRNVYNLPSYHHKSVVSPSLFMVLSNLSNLGSLKFRIFFADMYTYVYKQLQLHYIKSPESSPPGCLSSRTGIAASSVKTQPTADSTIGDFLKFSLKVFFYYW